MPPPTEPPDPALRRPATRLRDGRPTWLKLKDWLKGRPRPVKPATLTPLEPPKPGRIGICCSGGGIRSAAYCLGALQVLREEGVLGEAELVSAVSGGSYIASSFATVASCSPDKLLGEDMPPVYAPGSPEEQHLRNNSTYMAPGAGGKLRLVLRFVFSLAVNLGFIALALFACAIPLAWLYEQMYPELVSAQGRGLLDVPTWAWLASAAPAALGVVLALPDLMKRLKDDRRRLRLEIWSYRALVGSAIVFLVLVAMPQLILWMREISLPVLGGLASDLLAVGGGDDAAEQGDETLLAVSLTGAITSLLGALRAVVARRPTTFAIAAGAIAGQLAVVAGLLFGVNLAVAGGVSSAWLAALAGAIAVGAFLWLVADLTQWSLHPFYRRRLSSAFFVRRVEGRRADEVAVEELDYRKPLRLSALRTGEQFPKLIVCAAANVSDQGETPPGRAATPFTFSSSSVGGPLVGAVSTEEFERQGDRSLRDVTLPAAVAMSGAAVSPAMGKMTIRALTFLMALLNIRLGVWIPSPRHGEEVRKSRFSFLRPISQPARSARRAVTGAVTRTVIPDALRRIGARLSGMLRRPRATPAYLFREMLGRTSIDDRFLYVTDGGHYDNLGLVELLRRGCTRIYCLDGGGDPSGTYRALGEAVALARSELQVDVAINPEPIIPDKKTHRSETDHVRGEIRYRVSPTGQPLVEAGGGDDPGDQARIVYCRAAVTDDAPWDVLAYQEKTRRFPYHSTFDQLFDDQKFEAYRSLGAHTARRAVAAMSKGDGAGRLSP